MGNNVIISPGESILLKPHNIISECPSLTGRWVAFRLDLYQPLSCTLFYLLLWDARWPLCREGLMCLAGGLKSNLLFLLPSHRIWVSFSSLLLHHLPFSLNFVMCLPELVMKLMWFLSWCWNSKNFLIYCSSPVPPECNIHSALQT